MSVVIELGAWAPGCLGTGLWGGGVSEQVVRAGIQVTEAHASLLVGSLGLEAGSRSCKEAAELLSRGLCLSPGGWEGGPMVLLGACGLGSSAWCTGVQSRYAAIWRPGLAPRVSHLPGGRLQGRGIEARGRGCTWE